MSTEAMKTVIEVGGGQTKPLAAGHTCEELFLIGSFEMGSPILDLATSFRANLCKKIWKEEEFAFFLLPSLLLASSSSLLRRHSFPGVRSCSFGILNILKTG